MTTKSLLADRYRILRLIGSGGMGEVYLVEDTARDNQVMALKTMKLSDDPKAMENFRSEFSSIRGVSHPHIPEVYHFGTLPERNGQLFFTSEYVDGKPLDQLTGRWEPNPLRNVLVALCRALSFLHSRGLVHRDLKPENVLGSLDSTGQLSLLKLVDFGLAVSGDRTDLETGGTVEYMAPEILRGEPPSSATDLYALGMLLYKLAAGRLPFDNQNSPAQAKQRASIEAPPAFRCRPDLPVGFSDVISAMIRIDPGDRPPSARHVIALLNEHEGTDYAYETPQTRTAYIRSAASVTHTAVRRRLTELRRGLQNGEAPPHIILSAVRGLGCSRLIRDFASELSLENIPIKLIRDNSDLADNPRQGNVILIPNASKLEKERLEALWSRCTHGDIWCIAGFRPDEIPGTGKQPVEILSLEPLNIHAARGFINATFPQNSFPDRFADELLSSTLGFPGAMQSLFDNLLQKEMLHIGLAGWELMPGSWDVMEHSAVAGYINGIVSGLTKRSRMILNLLVCSRSPLPKAVIEKATSISESSLAAEIEPLRAVHWLKKTADGLSLNHRIVIHHIYGSLEKDERDGLHRVLGNAWSNEYLKDHPEQKREILFHDFKAGDWKIHADETEAVFKKEIERGNVVWIRSLLEDALTSDPPALLRPVFLNALARAEYIEGNFEAAASRFAELLDGGRLEITPDTMELFARYAVLEEKLGRTSNAEAVLKRCRETLPEGQNSQAGAVFGTLAWIAFKKGEREEACTLAEEGLSRVPPKTADAGYALLLNTVATSAFYRGDTDAAALTWNRCLEVNREINDRKGIATVYNNLGVVAAQSGDRLKARGLWEKCAEISREINDVHRLAGIYNNLGIDSLESGALQQAEEYYRKSLALFRRMNSPREQVEILSNLGELSLYRADFARSQAYLTEAVRLAENLDDRESEVEPLIYLGKLLIKLEQLEQAEQTLKQACGIAREIGVKKGEGQALEGLAVLHSRSGRTSDALKELEEAHRLITAEVDPLARLHLDLTECELAAQMKDSERVRNALDNARKAADTKWDPYTDARTTVCGLLFAQEKIDGKDRARINRKLSVFPDFLWRYHWAGARQFTASGALKKALDEYGRGVSVLKTISSRLSEDTRSAFLNSPYIQEFKTEALNVRKLLQNQ